MAKTKKKQHPVFLVIVDDSEEMHQALQFACGRAEAVGGKVALLYCIAPSEFEYFAGVGELMRAEAREAAEEKMSIQTIIFNSSFVRSLSIAILLIKLRIIGLSRIFFFICQQNINYKNYTDCISFFSYTLFPRISRHAVIKG